MKKDSDIKGFEGAQSPGAGGGQVGNPAPYKMEQVALDKKASFPGNEENAAGMKPKEAADDDAAQDEDELV